LGDRPGAPPQQSPAAGWTGGDPARKLQKTIDMSKVKAELGYSAADYFSMIYELITNRADVNMDDLTGTELEQAETELFKRAIAESLRVTMWIGDKEAGAGTEYATFNGFIKRIYELLVENKITAAKTEYKAKEPEVISGISQTITEEDLNKAVKMIQKAKKPYIFVGGGAVISGASEELKKFVKMVDAPVCDSLMGKGAFDGEDDLYTGMLGMHGTKASNLGVSECDLLIAVGVRFSDRVLGNAKKFASQADILQFDVDPAEINKNIQTDASVIGDIKEILLRVNERLTQMNHTEWITHIMDYKVKYPLTYPKTGLSGPYVIEEIYRETNGDAIIVTEVGQHQMWAAQYYKYKKPRTLLTSGGLGTMGYGLGAAIGAQIGCPEKQVINIAGDGCFRMNMNEIATAVRQKLPLIEVIINNHVLGMVRQWQDLFYEKRYSATVLDDGVDYVKLAEAMGAAGYRATNREEFNKALKKALASDTPVVIDCIINSDDKVWPMVAPGEAISSAFTGDDLKKKQEE